MADDLSDSKPVYEHKSAVSAAANVGLKAGAVGLVVSSIQNALGKHSYGAMGVVTRTGGTIGFFAAMGASFAFTETYVANEREKSDHVNGFAGGCAAGFLAGVRNRSLPLALGSCVLLGGAVGVYDYAGNITGSTESREERRNKFFKHPPKPLIEAPPSE